MTISSLRFPLSLLSLSIAIDLRSVSSTRSKSYYCIDSNRVDSLRLFLQVASNHFNYPLHRFQDTRCRMGLSIKRLRGGRFGSYESDPLELPEDVPSNQKSLNAQLRDAARDGNITDVQQLIERGARVNAVERGSHACALATAAFQNDRDLVRYLLSVGADPNIQDEHQMTPLHYAAGWGYAEVVDILMCAGANPEIGNMVRTFWKLYPHAACAHGMPAGGTHRQRICEQPRAYLLCRATTTMGGSSLKCMHR